MCRESVWLEEELQLSIPWSGVSSISPVSNSQAIICRVLKPALPATLRQFILLPLVVTRPPSVLCSCSPVFFIRLFSVPSLFRFISCRASQQCWSCSTQLLRSSCKPKVTHFAPWPALLPVVSSFGFLPSSGPSGTWTISAYSTSSGHSHAYPLLC